jgi:hypothetical protein
MEDVAGLYAAAGLRLREISSNGWVSTRCFAGTHPDRHPSARVNLRSGGFRCFKCGVRGGAIAALELLGVERARAVELCVEHGILEPAQGRSARRARPGFPARVPSLASTSGAAPAPSPTPANATQVDWNEVTAFTGTAVRDRTWVYDDEHGVALGRIRRLDLADGTKRIWVERPDGDGWKPGLAGTALPLYRLPEVLERASRGKRVLLVEGEKAVDALERLGIFATTNPGGARKWREQHTAALAGATVLAVADCDLPGRLHAIDVSLELLANGVRVRDPLDLNPLARDSGFDVVDYLAGVGETLRAVAPEIADRDLRACLRDHLERELGRQLPADSNALLRRHERVLCEADGDQGKALLECERCSDERVHRLVAGLAYCPCGAHRGAT